MIRLTTSEVNQLLHQVWRRYDESVLFTPSRLVITGNDILRTTPWIVSRTTRISVIYFMWCTWFQSWLSWDTDIWFSEVSRRWTLFCVRILWVNERTTIIRCVMLNGPFDHARAKISYDSRNLIIFFFFFVLFFLIFLLFFISFFFSGEEGDSGEEGGTPGENRKKGKEHKRSTKKWK